MLPLSSSVCPAHEETTSSPLALEHPDPDPVPGRGGGGAWRAFTHMMSGKEKLTKESMRHLGQAYRMLSAEEKARYKQIGKQATIQHQQGLPAFTAWSARAKRRQLGHASESPSQPDASARKCLPALDTYARTGVLSAHALPDILAALQPGEKPLSSLIRTLATSLRLDKRQEKAALSDITSVVQKRSQQLAAELLQTRRLLQELPAASWHYLPSDTPTLACSHEPEKVPDSVTTPAGIRKTHKELASQWRTRHLGVKRSTWKLEPPCSS